MNFFRKWVFLLLIELFARDDKYAWNSTAPRNLEGRDYLFNQDVHRLLKQGLEIGYLPPTRYNSKLSVSSIVLKQQTLKYFFSVMNRLGNFGDSLGDAFSDIQITKDSVTWGERKSVFEKNCSFTFPERGFYRRSNERSVLPHAIGCKLPSYVFGSQGYRSVLQGAWLIMKIFQLKFSLMKFSLMSGRTFIIKLERTTWIYQNP